MSDNDTKKLIDICETMGLNRVPWTNQKITALGDFQVLENGNGVEVAIGIMPGGRPADRIEIVFGFFKGKASSVGCIERGQVE